MEEERRNPETTETIPTVPNDLIEEILHKLPVKSLVRFTFVSKQWTSIIKSRDFVEKNLIRQKSGDPKIIVATDPRYSDPDPRRGTVCLTTLSIEDDEDMSCCYAFPDRFHLPFRVSGSCDGLVCIEDRESIYLINPATGEHRKLPPAWFQLWSDDSNPSVERRILIDSTVVFGKDIVTGTYKVVWIYWSYDFDKSSNHGYNLDVVGKCEVFSLETEVWKYVEITSLWPDAPLQGPFYASGALYWIACEDNGEWKVLVFDLHTERFCKGGHVTYAPLEDTKEHGNTKDLAKRTMKSEVLSLREEDDEWKLLRFINTFGEFRTATDVAKSIRDERIHQDNPRNPLKCYPQLYHSLFPHVHTSNIAFHFETLVSLYP